MAPRLTATERARRAGVARRKLLPAGIRAAGRRGFRGTVAKLEKYRDRIKSPERLAGYLKGAALHRGELSKKHPYVGRRGYRKYPALIKGRSKVAYSRLLARRRT